MTKARDGGGDGDYTIELKAELRGNDFDRLVVVGSDLEFLLSLPQERLLTHTEVRLAAGILRRLLIDDELGAVLHTMNAPRKFQPRIEATFIDAALAKWPQKWLRHAWAGGASVKGGHHKGLVLAVVPKEEHERYSSPQALIDDMGLPRHGEMRKMGIRDWLRTTAVAVQTDQLGLVRITRSSVVKYVANRKGGVHFDPKRNLHLAGKKRRREVEAHLLDHGLLRVGHLSGPEFEIASMVHAIRGTEWAADLVQLARDAAAGQISGDPMELKVWTGVPADDGTGWATWRFTPNEPTEKSADETA